MLPWYFVMLSWLVISITMKLHAILLVFFIFIEVIIAARPVEDKVTDLPGVNFQLQFEQYSGYVNAGDGIFYHYWFFESQSNVDKDPLILFLNGGPGCSSLTALFVECGPFRIKHHGQTIFENPYSWNKISNLLFLESPVGVGFSYATVQAILSDEQSVLYHWNALISLFRKFPEFDNRSVFLVGQSYAAVYVTTLAKYIQINANEFPGKLEGIALANGFLSYSLRTTTQVFYNYYHGLISKKQWREVMDNCCNPQPDSCDLYKYLLPNATDQVCHYLVQNALDASSVGRDPFNINYECYAPNSDYSEDEECGVPFGTITAHYLNRKDVRDAAHVNIAALEGYSFEACSDAVKANYTIQYIDLTNVMKQVISAGNIRVLIFNGDYDSVLNYFGAHQFVDDLNINATSDRTPIYYSKISRPNVGYQQQYGNLDLLVVRGAGHYVPADRPRESQQIMTNFLRGQRNYSIPDDLDTTPAPLIADLNSGTKAVLCTDWKLKSALLLPSLLSFYISM